MMIIMQNIHRNHVPRRIDWHFMLSLTCGRMTISNYNNIRVVSMWKRQGECRHVKMLLNSLSSTLLLSFSGHRFVSTGFEVSIRLSDKVQRGREFFAKQQTVKGITFVHKARHYFNICTLARFTNKFEIGKSLSILACAAVDSYFVHK